MTLSKFWFKRFRQRKLRWKIVKTYRAISTASVDSIWAKLSDMADVSWNPMLWSTDAPEGLTAKPGLIFRAMSQWLPVPSHLFIEEVQPNQFLSIRILALPGLEERVTYQIAADVKGTFISYSIMLRGWLTPIFWPFLHLSAQRVAIQLAQSNQEKENPTSSNWLSRVIDF